MKKIFLILLLFLSVAANGKPKIKYDDKLKKSIWEGVPDANYVWEGEVLAYEREITDEEGKKRRVKTYKKPIKIIADFKPNSKVFGVDSQGKIEHAAVRKFGGALKGFVWLDKVSGSGEVILPFTAKHIFVARGDRLNPTLTEIGTDPNEDNYYEIVEGKTRVYVKSFSGVGGAAGAPPALIAHYKMNDNLATSVIIDETGTHNGAVKDATGTATSAFHSVVGKINKAQDCDGTDDYIEIADHAGLTPALTPFSISVWVYMHDATNFMITTKGIINTNGEWQFYLNASDILSFRLYDNSEGSSCRIGRYYNTTLTSYENQWIHFVATYDGGALATGIKLYLNGVRIDDISIITGTFVAIENLAHAVWIGRYSTSYANGLIDNVMFFSTELDIFEVQALYNHGSGTEIIAEIDARRGRRRN